MTKDWYPRIDYDRCIGCLQCYNFCPNGVYELDVEGKPRVVHPENCVDQCKACAKLCDQGAIIFAGDSPQKKEGSNG